MLQTQHLLCSHFPICLSPPQTHFLFPPSLSSSPLNFLYKPVSLCSVSAHSRSRPEQWLAEAPEPTTSIPTAPYTPLEFAPEGPEELPPASSPVFATTDDPSSIQVATSVLLTGAISVFLFRSLRRRARRAKELKFRSSGVKKSLKEEALDSLKALSTGSIEEKGPPSPVQALLGGISAGVIALILYKFTTTIEQVQMANKFPTGDARQPPQNIRVVPVNGTLDICDNEITATNAREVGIFNFNNMTDHTGQDGRGCTDVTKRGRNISGNKINAEGGKGVGISNFGNCTLHKNSNDKDDAAAGRKKKSAASK